MAETASRPIPHTLITVHGDTLTGFYAVCTCGWESVTVATKGGATNAHGNHRRVKLAL